MMMANLIEDFYENGGFDDYDLFQSFCANYRLDDYRHCVPINAPEGTGFEHEDE